MFRSSNYIILAVFVLISAVAGCSDAQRRFAVSGAVSLDGKPLDDVTIIFTPEGPGLSGAAEVIDGQFVCSEKSGPSSGTFNVRLSPNEAEMEAVEQDLSELKTPRRPRVPLKYQKLGALQVEITGADDQVVQLELKS